MPILYSFLIYIAGIVICSIAQALLKKNLFRHMVKYKLNPEHYKRELLVVHSELSEDAKNYGGTGLFYVGATAIIFFAKLPVIRWIVFAVCAIAQIIPLISLLSNSVYAFSSRRPLGQKTIWFSGLFVNIFQTAMVIYMLFICLE